MLLPFCRGWVCPPRTEGAQCDEPGDHSSLSNPTVSDGPNDTSSSLASDTKFIKAWKSDYVYLRLSHASRMSLLEQGEQVRAKNARTPRGQDWGLSLPGINAQRSGPWLEHGGPAQVIKPPQRAGGSGGAQPFSLTIHVAFARAHEAWRSGFPAGPCHGKALMW